MSQTVSDREFDRSEMLDRMGGDEELLQEIVSLFLDEYSTMLAELRQAVSGADPQRIERSAHALKGALLNMSAVPAAELAQQLESMGNRGELQPAAPLLADLERRLERLAEQLAD